MANTYKDIVITPNKSSSTDDPKIVFSGANASVNTDITLRVYPDSNGTLSFEGSAGQLFSITNDFTGSIFSVNDVSGIPSIDVDAYGTVELAPYSGNVGIGTTNPQYKLDVNGDARITGNLTLGDATTDTITVNAANFNLANNVSFDSGTLYIDKTNDRIGIGTTNPSTKLTVEVGTSGLQTGLYVANGDLTVARAASTGVIYFGRDSGSKYLYHDGSNYNFGNAGYVTTPQSFRAPTFYDTDNTAYYVDPAGATGLYTLGNIQVANGRKGLVGVYDPSQTQAIFAMGGAYVLTDGGSSNTYGAFYGIGWSYDPDYGGAGNNPQSKSGLTHQALFMKNGITQTAIGTGIWTGGVGTSTLSWRAPAFYDSDNTAYYVDGAATSYLSGLNLSALANVNISSSTGGLTPSHLQLNNGTGSQTVVGFTFGGVSKASIRVDSSGNMIINNTANTFFFGYDTVPTTTSFRHGQSGAFMSVTGTTVTFSSVVTGSISANAAFLNGFTSSNSASPVAANTMLYNGLSYVNSQVASVIGAQTDGALYSQAYSTSWVHQIYGDYRTGQIALRGMNSGTWQPWRVVLDSSNYNGYALNGSNTFNIGTTSVALNRASANLTVAGVNTDGYANYTVYGMRPNQDDYQNARVIRNINSSSYNDGMFIGYGNSNSGYTRIYGEGATTGPLIKYATYSAESGSFRAPLFYDSDNTAYYANPAGASQFYAIYANSILNSGNYAVSYLMNTYETRIWNSGSTVLGDGTVGDLLAFRVPNTAEFYNGTAWSSTTVVNDTFCGKNAFRFGNNYTLNNTTQQRVRFTWNAFGYNYIDNILVSGTTNGNNLYITIEGSTDGTTWSTLVAETNTGTTWPGHNSIRCNVSNSAANPYLRITLRNDLTNTNGIGIMNISLFGPYAGMNRLFDWDSSRNVSFYSNITTSGTANVSTHLLSSYSASNFQVTTPTTGAAGILLKGGSTFAAQLYGDGTAYGFLGSAWGGWDIRKVISGNTYFNNDNTCYLNPAVTSRFNNVIVAGAFASDANTAYYYDAAVEVRELNFGGAQADIANCAPRIGMHWGGRVASQIVLESSGRIAIRNNPGNGYEAFAAGNMTGSGTLTVAGIATFASNITLGSNGNINFTQANPYLTASSYIIMPGGLYVSGGIPYFANQAQFRGGIHNDGATYLSIDGGTSAITNFTGNVGINNTAPTEKLHIVGGNIYLPYATANTGALIGSASSDNFTTDGVILPHYSLKWAVGAAAGGSPSAFLSGYGGIRLFTGGTEQVRITGSNVGIGNTAPALKLEVAGNMSVQNFVEYSQNVATNVTITTGRNALTGGPTTINSGVTVTIPSGSVWTIA